jgi:tetratricopeptide (TPR) repeat protein
MATSRKRNIEIEWLIDDKQATKSLKKIEGQVTKTGESFTRMAKGLAAGIGLREVGQLAMDSIRAFSDLNESLNAVDVTFGGAAQGIKELGEDAAKSLGLSNAEFNSLAVGFSAFAETIATESGSTIVPVMDDLTTRIADFASVMNLDVNEAAIVFRSGLAGETEPLRKFGIDVSAAAVNQKALALGLADSSSELTEQDKILSRYHLIMDQTNKTAGDFENTSDELANQQRILTAETENLKAALGESLAPTMNQVVGLSNDFLTVLNEVTQSTGDSAPVALEALKSGFETVFNTLTFHAIPAVSSWADSIRETGEAQDELDQAKWDALFPTDAQIANAGRADEKFFDLAETLGLLAENSGDAATAQQELNDILREGVDPAFKLLRAVEKYDDAQDAYTTAISKFSDGSVQAQEAARNLADAQLDLDAAGSDFAAGGGSKSVEILQELLENAGVLPETIQAIIEAIKEYNDTPITRKEVFVPGVGNVTPGTGGTIGGGGSTIGFASGGVVPGPRGAPMLATVHGGEEVLTPEQRGSSGSTLITLNALTMSDRMLKETLEMARRK